MIDCKFIYVDRYVRYLHIHSTNMPHIECQGALMVEGASEKGCSQNLIHLEAEASELQKTLTILAETEAWRVHIVHFASQFWFSEALGFEYTRYTRLRTQKPGQHDPAASKRESTVSPLQEDWTDVLHVLHPLCFGAKISLNLGPFSANVHSVNLVWTSCELRFEKTVPEVKADHREWQQEVIDLPLPGRRTNATPMRIFARCYHILSSNIYHDKSWGLVCRHWHTHYLARWLWWRESISSIHPKASWCCALGNHHGKLGSS